MFRAYALFSSNEFCDNLSRIEDKLCDFNFLSILGKFCSEIYVGFQTITLAIRVEYGINSTDSATNKFNEIKIATLTFR